MARVRRVLVKLQLLEMGETDIASSLDDMVHPPVAEDDKEGLHASEVEDKLKRFEDDYYWLSLIHISEPTRPY